MKSYIFFYNKFKPQKVVKDYKVAKLQNFFKLTKLLCI